VRFHDASTTQSATCLGIVKRVLLIVGVLASLLGLWWILQGTGVAPVGFMANQMPWAYRGMGLAAVGLGLVYASRRIA
jgi:hypothetical protein